MKKSRIFIFIVVAILAFVGYWLISSGKTFFDNAKDSQIVSLLKNYGVAEEIYFSSYKEFAANEEKLGLSYKIKGVKVFFAKDLVPTEYLNILPEASLPFVTKNSYRILLMVEKDNGRQEFWKMDENKNPSKLKEFFELK